jgi:hypothetical protein
VLVRLEVGMDIGSNEVGFMGHGGREAVSG